MFKKIKEFFMGKPVEVNTPAASYKVEAPAAVVETAPVVEAIPTPVVDQVAVVNAAEASALTTAPEKKARKPRTPKAETSKTTTAKTPAARKAKNK